MYCKQTLGAILYDRIIFTSDFRKPAKQQPAACGVHEYNRRCAMNQQETAK